MENSKRKINGDVALAVPKKDKKYLILKRSEQNSSSGEWVFPGGKIENEETVKEAAIRELQEETGITGQIMNEGESYIGQGELGYWKIYPVHVNVENKDVRLNHEHSDYKWLSIEELQNHNTMGQLQALKMLDIL